MTAQAWSAVAACAAAIAAFLLYHVQRKTLMTLVRPDLILDGWERKSEGEDELLCFRQIENAGPGVATLIYVELDRVTNPPVAALTTIRIPILGPEVIQTTNAQIILFWKNAPTVASKAKKYIPLTLVISCLDSQERLHQTRYVLHVRELHQEAIMAEGEIAPGVMLVSRHVTTKGVWFRRRIKQNAEYFRSSFEQWVLPQIRRMAQLVRDWWAKQKKR